MQDAVTFVETELGRAQGQINPSRICIWGIGHSGAVCIIAGGTDPRIAAVILLMPVTSGRDDVAVHLTVRGIQELLPDRVAKTGTSDDPTYIPLWPTTHEEALRTASQRVWDFVDGGRRRSDAAGTEWTHQVTLQSFYHIGKVEPQDMIHKIAPRPLLYLAAQEDGLTGTMENHTRVFARAGQPKGFIMLPGHHLGTYMYLGNEAFEISVATQIRFLKQYLG